MAHTPNTPNPIDEGWEVSSHGLGEVYREACDFAEAEQRFESRLATTTEPLERSVLLQKIGQCRERRGDYRAALESLGEAKTLAQRLGERSAEGGATFLIGKILFLTSDLTGARERALRARELLHDDPDVGRRGAVENLLGGIAYRLGDIDRARRHFDEALVLGKDGRDLTLLSRAYNNLGLIHKALCDWDQAIDAFHASLGFDSTAANYDSRYTAWINLGIVHAKRGDLREAEAMFTRAKRTCEEVGNPVGQVRSLLGQAGVHRSRRDYDASLELLGKAANLARQHQLARELILVDAARAWIDLDRGDLDSCRRYLDHAMTAAERLSTAGELICHLVRLESNLRLRAGDAAGALERALLCTELARQCGDRFERAAVGRIEGSALAALGRWEQGADAFARAVRDLRRMGARHELARALLDWGRFETRHAPAADQRGVLDRLTEAAHLLENLGDEQALVPAYLAQADVHEACGRSERALERLRDAWDHLSAAHPEKAALRDELSALQQRLEARLLDSAHRERNRVLALVGLLESLRRNSDGRSLEQFLDQVGELLAADGALLCLAPQAPDCVMQSMASSGLRVQERRAILEILSEACDRITGADARQPFFFVVDPRGTSIPLVERLENERRLGSVAIVPVITGDRTWLLYLDRERQHHEPRPFSPADLELISALAHQLPTLLDAFAQNPEDSGPAAVDPVAALDVGELVYDDPHLREILESIAQIRGSSIRVLLQGEAGTGKGVLARIIHRNSARRDRPFRALNCATLPATLLESELFGHVRGAFPGATKGKIGLLEEADGGTVFLDDIEKAGASVQRRLLHFLDCGEIRPVGSAHRRSLDVRVICATSSPDLEENVRQGSFSKELYYRLHHFTITVPPLRERRTSIAPLAHYFLERLSNESGVEVHEFSTETMQLLEEHDWPGNVRELENVVRRAVVLGGDGKNLGPGCLPSALRKRRATAAHTTATDGASLQEQVEALEKELVRDAIDRHGGNKSRAALELGLTRKGLRNKMHRYGIDGP